MVVEESIHVFYESNNSLQGRKSFDDDVGLDFSMGRLKIKDGNPQQEKEMESNKGNQSPLELPLPHLNQSKENQVKDFQKSGNLSQITHKIK